MAVSPTITKNTSSPPRSVVIVTVGRRPAGHGPLREFPQVFRFAQQRWPLLPLPSFGFPPPH